jgi:hypothetical protein
MPRDTRSAAEQLTSWRILEHAREERRRVQRRVVKIPARIDVGGGAIRDCTVVDVSVFGAKLAIEGASELPDSFILLLTPSGHPARRCHVAWRSDDDDTLGVEFEIELGPEHLVH